MTTHDFKIVDQFLKDCVEAHQIPGVVYGVINRQETIAENAIGYSYSDKKIPMKLDSLFDLASLTKVCATLPSILLLLEQGQIDFDDPVRLFFSEEVNPDLTLMHLLTHTSGFPPSFPFYRYAMDREAMLHFILTIEAKPDVDTVYSDLNFILLGFLVEKLTDCTLDQFTKKNIYEPLKMVHTGFNPTEELYSIVPTEWMPRIGKYQWGHVHDENANYMGGVSGHAGLFSNLHDLKNYVRMLMNNGKMPDGNYFLSPATLIASRKNYTGEFSAARGIGWQLNEKQYSPGGYLVSKGSYGHTGFTGTSFWIDPDRQLGFILLSNRVHISRKINMNRIRRIFVNLVLKCLSED
ncbi:serine hydrolase domain-containing protein [Sporolactobacillus nakayamae]|uniref:CubicO group peptidase, beta-lactamase class C family n=1 Tax=Sporolactobacillus nakayamae TaxID=269670 RepID=A0A1I2TCN1_9BACL|nr:serine hydrolase domain-containing protein [Sporolactobacillus nakayamae]SFG62588.1 CubicO group peptidase, beta-lactamase class C family [Sporolactobacillus nakayamae]